MRLSRNIEYIENLEKPYHFKCDQKDLIIDNTGRAVVVYQSAIYNNKTLWITAGNPEIGEIVKRVNFNIGLPYKNSPEGDESDKKTTGPEKTPLGLIPIYAGIVISLAAIVRKRKRRNI